MAHFAEIIDGHVNRVIVVPNEDLDFNGEFPQSEPSGQAFIASIGLSGLWLQASYNNNFRGVYPGPGYIYDAELDQFIAPGVTDEAV